MCSFYFLLGAAWTPRVFGQGSPAVGWALAGGSCPEGAAQIRGAQGSDPPQALSTSMGWGWTKARPGCEPSLSVARGLAGQWGAGGQLCCGIAGQWLRCWGSPGPWQGKGRQERTLVSSGP